MPLPPLPPLTLLWVVPALPLAGFVVNGALALAAPGAKRAVSLVGVGVLVLAFAAAAVAVLKLAQLHPSAPVVVGYWDWLPVSDLQVAFALQLDQLSAVMTGPPAGNAVAALGNTVPKSSEPVCQKINNIATRNPKSPMRLTMKAFLPASALICSLNQNPINR